MCAELGFHIADDPDDPGVKTVTLTVVTLRKLDWPCLAHDHMAGNYGDKLSSRFARVRVRVAHRDYWLAGSGPKEWLLIEWPAGENEPMKYWVSTLPEDVAFRQLVDIAKLRWRIEPELSGTQAGGRAGTF